MDAETRKLLKLAKRIHDTWEPPQGPSPLLPLPPYSILQEIYRLQAQNDEAVNRGYLVGKKIQNRLVSRIRDYNSHLQNAARAIDDRLTSGKRAPAASVHSLFKDLYAINKAFPEFEHVDHTIRVRTSPVTIEGFDFGPFYIYLHYYFETIPRRRYWVEAINPNPAACNPAYVHPHVEGYHLCEGEAAAPVHYALEDMRLLDFFTVMNVTLHSYSPETAYLPLEHWEHLACQDCGEHFVEEDMMHCNTCDSRVCSCCAGTCSQCGDETLYCANCIYVCNEFVTPTTMCMKPLCRNCATSCANCERSFCPEHSPPSESDPKVLSRCGRYCPSR